jgi:hypothetical protein
MIVRRIVSLGLLMAVVTMLAGCVVEPVGYYGPHHGYYGDEYHGWHHY